MRRRFMAVPAAIALTLAGLAAAFLLTAGGSAANPNAGFTPVTLCHATGSATNPFVTITVSTQGALNGHLGHPNDIIPAPPEGCPGGNTTTSTSTSTTTTTVPTVGNPLPPITGTAGLTCRTDDDIAPALRLSVVAAGDTSTTVGMEKDILQCSGAATQTRDLETFIEVVQAADANGLNDVAVRIHTALCVKDFSVGRVQCVRRDVPVGGMLTNPLGGCKNGKHQPSDPVQMASKGVGPWFKTTKVEKQVIECPNGTLDDLYIFTDVLSSNPPTAAPSTTTFRGILCAWTPSAGVPPLRCNTVKVT